MSTPLMRIENVSMIFEKRQSGFKKPAKVGAVVDLSVDIGVGEVLALVGESGCGKTTLGHLIVGLQKPTHGKILWNGKDIHSMSRGEYKEFRHSVQLVQQDSYAALNPVETIQHSLVDPLLSKRVMKTKAAALQRVKEVLRFVDLTPEDMYLEKYPHQLSGGQRQRILMARAILQDPKLIVADEPVSMIDVSLRIAILNLMARLNKTLGISFVYITHDFATAKYIARDGNIAIMYLGRIAEYGNVREVLRNPSHPYLQALLTAVPVPDPVIAKQKRALPLKSIDMPSPVNPPSGCRFHPRCPWAKEICSQEDPPLVDFHKEKVACHLAVRGEIPEWRLETVRKEKTDE